MSAPLTSVPPGGLSRVPYLPGLDGMRAIAVVAVMIYHANHDWISGGFLGVEVFFVISGYLITLLLLAEHEKHGFVNLGQFWLRRARRLLPALFVMLAFVALYLTAFYPQAREATRGDFFGGIFYVSNWYQLWAGQGYSAGEAFVPLRHLWSLAVEEQFYILWPLLMVLVLRSSKAKLPAVGLRFFGVSLLIAGLTAMLFHGDPVTNVEGVRTGYWHLGSKWINTNEFLYLSTITRAGGLFLGAGFAMLWRPAAILRGPLKDKGRRLDVLAVAALVLLLVQMFTVFLTEKAGQIYSGALFRGGFLITGLLTLVMIAAVTHQRASAGRLFGHPALVWVGTRSYGLYLFHWPIYQIIRKEAGRSLSLAQFILAMLLTVAVTEASYRYIETPIRTGHFKEMLAGIRRNGAQTMGAFAVAAALGLASCSILVADPACVGAQTCAQQENAAGDTTLPPEATATVPQSTNPGDTTPVSQETTTTVSPVEQYVAIGDSVMVGAADQLGAAGFFVFARESRGPEGVMNSVIKLRDEDRVIGAGTKIVIQVGLNTPLTEENIAAIMAEVPADVGGVWFMTIHGDVLGEDESNALVRSLPATYPLVKGVIDWDATAGTVELCSDGIHISCGVEASTAYTNLILQAVGLPTIS